MRPIDSKLAFAGLEAASRARLAKVLRACRGTITPESAAAALADTRLATSRQLARWAEQVFRSVCVATSRRPRHRQQTIGGTVFALHTVAAAHFFGLKAVWRGATRVQVSDPSRTVLDLLATPAWGGGIRMVVDVLQAYLKLPGAKLSVQMHHHRAEHWIVVSGTARLSLDGQEQLLTENQSIYLPVGAVHALENPGKIALELIEVQVGSYLGEDDIVRLEDRYGRVEVRQ